MPPALPPTVTWKRYSAAALLGFGLLSTLGGGARGVEEQSKLVARSASFDQDPGWEGHNNRLLPKVLPTITQDFGYSETGFAGRKKGEVGARSSAARRRPITPPRSPPRPS